MPAITLPGLDGLSSEAIFNFSQSVMLPGILALILAPRWKYRQTLVYGTVLTNCLVYAATFVSSMAAQPDGLSGVGQMYAELRALDGVMKLFADSTIILPAWIHYLAVDMIGVNYLVEKNLADPAGLNQVLMGFIVILSLMAAPMGVLLYAVLKGLSSLLNGQPGVKRS